jgi:transposase
LLFIFVYNEEMSEVAVLGVRLRRPERSQLGWVARCADDLVKPDHPVRLIPAVVEKLDLSAFYEPIKARSGVSGRDCTDPALLVSLWLYACIRGIGSARELGRRCAESAPFLWLLGGVTVNHRLLSDFRTDHDRALNDLFTQVVASLVDKEVVRVSRISQDGVRVRVSAGAGSFRRAERLQDLLRQAREHVEQLRLQVEDKALSPRKKAMRRRAADDRVRRLEEAMEQLPELQQKQAEAERRAGNGSHGETVRRRQVRVSTTDAEARRMKMPNGGFNPAVNVQLAADTASRAIVGVEVTPEGSDGTGLSAPMRHQVERRTGLKVRQHLIDGGYLRMEDIEAADKAEVELFVPPKPARAEGKRDRELEPRPTDSPAILRWKKRMASDEGKEIYKQRAATSETVNADLRSHRGLLPMTVRGTTKMRCVALWCALAYNVFHFANVLVN